MFDFTRLSRVPVIEDITSASYALVTDYSDKNDEVKRAPLDFLKSDYTDVTSDFISSIEDDDAKKTYLDVLNYITSTLSPVVINEGGNEYCLAKNYYIGLDSDYYFIKTFGSISSTCHIIQRYNASDNAITEYKYNNLEKISEIRYAPNKLFINTFTDFTSGLNASKLKIDQIDFSTPSTRIICLTGSNSHDITDPVINIFAPNNYESPVVDSVRLNGIATPKLNTDAANKQYVDELFNELNSNEFHTLTAAQIYAGGIELHNDTDNSIVGLTCASGKLHVNDDESNPIIITNVSTGIDDLDAVNVGQLKAYVKEQMDSFDPDVSLDWDDIDNKPEDIFIYDSENDEWYVGLEHIYNFPTYIGQDFIQSPNIIGGNITGANIVGGSLTIDGTMYNSENSGSVLVTNSSGNTTFKIDEYGNVFINGTVQISGSESNVDWGNLGDLPWQEGIDSAVNTANAALSATQGAKIYYCTCSTSGRVATKVVNTVTDTDFTYDTETKKPFVGTTISVKFDHANTADSVKLKVDDTTAITVWVPSGALSKNSVYNWDAGCVVTFVYNGQYWCMSDTSTAKFIGKWCAQNDVTKIDGGSIYTGSITTEHMAADSINGNRIAAGTLDANRIKANTLSADQIYTGTLNAREVSFSCEASETDINDKGGGFTYAEGNDGHYTTFGAKMYAVCNRANEENYVIVTNSGARMTAREDYDEGNFNDASFYVTPRDSSWSMSNKSSTTYITISPGEIVSSTSITTSSDRTLKRNVSYDLNKYKQVFYALKPASFSYIDQNSDKEHLGFIAQDVENALSIGGITLDNTGIVSINDEKYGIAYTELIALNTAMIQDLLTKVDELEKEVANLKSL